LTGIFYPLSILLSTRETGKHIAETGNVLYNRKKSREINGCGT
jgi:hypothetical protein